MRKAGNFDRRHSAPCALNVFGEHARHRLHHRQPLVNMQRLVDAQADQEDDEVAVESGGEACVSGHGWPDRFDAGCISCGGYRVRRWILSCERSPLFTALLTERMASKSSG